MSNIYGICFLSVVPLRGMPSDTSEMVSQVLFGEYFSIVEKHGNWIKIKLLNDGYEGWIDHKSYSETDEKNYHKFIDSKKFFTSEFISKIHFDKSDFFIPMGSNLPFYHEGKFQLKDEFYTYQGNISPVKFDKENLIILSKSFLKAPYLWGGKTIFGIDCSGFTQIILGQFGVQLLRDASLQATQGELVSFISEAKTGDLAFFENDEGKIIHVGIVLPENQIIHAHGEVRIDTLDDMGIFNKKTGKHSHRLRFIKRFF